MNAILDAGWVDVVRARIPEPTRVYTWWSYRAQDWVASNRGRRLDHIWTSPELREAVDAITIRTEARGWQRPSDHVPVLARIAL